MRRVGLRSTIEIDVKSLCENELVINQWQLIFKIFALICCLTDSVCTWRVTNREVLAISRFVVANQIGVLFWRV